MEDMKVTASGCDFGAAHAAMRRYVDGNILSGVSFAVLVGRDLVDVNCVGGGIVLEGLTRKRRLHCASTTYSESSPIPNWLHPAQHCCYSRCQLALLDLATAPTTRVPGRSHGLNLSISAAISSSATFSAVISSCKRPRRKSRSAVSISPATKSSGTRLRPAS